MRRFAILIAIYAASCASWATAGPPGETPRLGAYGASVEELRPRQGSVNRAGYRDTRRGGYPQARRADYQETRPVYHAESVPAGPMTQAPPSESYQEGPTWQEEGYGDSYGDNYGSGDDFYGGECCDDSCGCAPSCAPGFWGRAEYLYWWTRGSATPPLVTTSPDGTQQTAAGVLPDATVLFGGDRLNTSGRSGGRFTLGYWFNDCCNHMGIDTTFLFLGDVNEQYYNSSSGSPILARPFFNVSSGEQDANLIAFPGVVTGSIHVQSTSNVNGGDVNLRRSLYQDCWKRFDVIAGYRYFQLSEGLQINTNTTSIDPQSPVPVGTTFGIFDNFGTRNNFNGGQLGIDTQLINGCWTIDILMKLALGSVQQRAHINGGTVVTVPNVAPVTSSGGILALDSNIGTYQRNRFGVLPELGINFRYQMTPLWRVNLGYTLMVLTNVIRPGDSIDTNVDPNQFPPSAGGSQPKFTFLDSDLWLQGINVGIECNF